MLSHADLIKAFGGSRQLAEAIGVDPKSAIHWQRRGIPAKYWPVVETTQIAQSHGITALRLKDLSIAAPQTAEAA